MLQREWAAEGLATLDWRIHPEIVQALVTAAQEDPAATVRVACLHDLAKMHVSTVLVVEAVHAAVALGRATPAALPLGAACPPSC